MNETKNYSIGLDIGTGSVGWAVLEDEYFLSRMKGKNMWGSRLFTNAETAKKTRLKRGIRRRYNKRRERIRLLRELMNNMVSEVDDTFFMRMENTTFLDTEDKIEKLGKIYNSHYNLFVERDFNDKTFYKKYPTIYHLRSELCKSDKKADPRLIYLALHHIVKYRGNFLREGQKIELGNVDDIIMILNELFEAFASVNDFENVLGDNAENLLAVFKLHTNRSEKQDKAIELFDSSLDKSNKDAYKYMFAGIVGKKFKVNKLFNDIALKENKTSISFADENFEETLEEIAFDEEKLEVITLMQKIYQWIELMNIVGEETNGIISDSMIRRYEAHKKDLSQLKSLIRKYKPEEYSNVFRSNNLKCNYKKYIEQPHDCTQDIFYDYVNKLISDIDDDIAHSILKKIENETFMLKQNGRTYAAIPYQLQQQELEMILEKQGKYYPDLLHEYNGINMIESILTFRIPYYYGPLNMQSSHGWIIKRNENARIMPWNHKEVVDVDATAEKFITSLTNYCTYIPSEKVMPKKSLVCQKYEVLTELNKVRINGKLIEKQTKNKIIKDLFLKKKKVTLKHLETWLYKNQIYPNTCTLKITGTQKAEEFASNLSSWIDMNRIIGINENNFDAIEKIIYYLTIFNDNDILRRKLKEFDFLTSSQIKSLSSLKYTGWSRLSKYLITGIKRKNKYAEFGERASILEVMEKSNLNLMEIINDDKLGYKKTIEEINRDIEVDEFSYDKLVKNLQGSPALKRGIWQTLLVVDELVRIKGKSPNTVCVEFARNEDKKERTQSAISVLKNDYKDVFNKKNEKSKNYRKDFSLITANKELNKYDKDTHIGERLQLYFLQMGKCMYTGEPLNIDELDLYEVDHVIGQSLLVDNSIDNKVLVKRKENQRKESDPVPASVRIKMHDYWQFLFDHKLMSAKKFANLNKVMFTEKDISRFINRQLVETRQITKHVANLLQALYPDTKIVTVRAELSHEFREKYSIPKSRLVNDYHHAHDAYIAGLLGNYTLNRFSSMESKYIYGQYVKYTKLSNKNYKHGYVLNTLDKLYSDNETGEVIWNPEDIAKIKKCFNYSDCYVTKKLEEPDGPLFKESVEKSKKNDLKTKSSIPVKKEKNDLYKFGGYTNENYCMYAITGEKVGKKKVDKQATIAKVPLRFKNESDEYIIKYLEKEENLSNVQIIRKNIKKYQLLEINGGLIVLASPTEHNSATQLILNKVDYELSSKIEYAVEKEKYTDEILTPKTLRDLYIVLVNKLKKYYPYYLSISNEMEKHIKDFESLSIANQCNVIYQTLKMMHANSDNANFKIKGYSVGSDRTGRMSKKTVDLTRTYFIEQSITGIYSNKRKLVL